MPPSVSLVIVSLAILFLFLVCPQGVCGNVITNLPGFSGPLPFYLETGYVGVDKSNNTQLFYYFIESEGNPKEEPLLLWLTGGPGCSAFSGLVFEIGPLKFNAVEYDGNLPTLVYFPNSWTKVSSIIFLDSPVGTGFSFSKKPEDYEVSDTIFSRQIMSFLTKWFVNHPQYLRNRFYIAGDSYAGKVVPMVALEIAKGIEAKQTPILNFEGYIIGNPITGLENDFNARVPFAHDMGIISDELYQVTSTNCKGENYLHPKSALCAEFLETVNKFFTEINMAQILEPTCPFASPKPEVVGYRRLIGEKRSDSFAKPSPPPPPSCRSYAYYLSYYWANNEAVRQALGIQKGTLKEWVRCSKKFNYTEDVKSNIVYHKSVLSRGFRALVYSGDLDMVVPYIGTREWIRSLESSIIDDWRSWHVDGQVAGYTRAYNNNLTFATVKGGGHTAPEYRPEQCLAMITRWLSYKPL